MRITLLVLFAIALPLLGSTGALAQADAPQALTCESPPPKATPRGNLLLTLTVDDKTVWQPRNGEVIFEIKGTEPVLENANIKVCFRWASDPKANWINSPSVRRILSDKEGVRRYSATVPPDLESLSGNIKLDCIVFGA